MSPKNAEAGAQETVHELIRQREQLRGWIQKLDEVKREAPDRVAERVRADYQARLTRVNEELASHRDEIERGLASLRADQAEAEARLTQAVDALDEMRLRHLIGEVDEDAWGDARTALENDVREAEEALSGTREQVERLTVLVGDITGEPEPAAPGDEAAEEPAAEAALEPAADAAPEATGDAGDSGQPAAEASASGGEPSGGDTSDQPTAEQPAGEGPSSASLGPPPGEEWDPFGNEFTQPGAADAAAADGGAGDDLPWLSDLEKPAGGAAWDAPGGDDVDALDFLKDIESNAPQDLGAAGDLAPDDLAFLEELDRAISGSTQRGAPASPPAAAQQPAAPQPAAAPAAKPGTERLLCKECGALNEPHSWYCEVCGSEL